jgi:carbamoyl-phosphate synthase large subunit
VGLSFDHRFTGCYATGLFDEVFLIPPPAQGERSFVEALDQIRRKSPLDVLLPTLDPEAALCAAAARSLRAFGIRTLVPSPTAIRRRAKSVLGELARSFGFGTPKTIMLTSRSGIASALRELPLPFFLKGSFADARMVTIADEAYAEFDSLVARWGVPLLAQERVFGDELNLAMLFNRKSEPVGAIPMRKLGITDRGKGWAGVTVRLAETVERAGALLRSIGWVGPAEMEMIRDPTSNRIHLIEINPRFPAWTYLTAAAGQNLPWAAVLLATGYEIRHFPDGEAGLLFTRSVEDYFGPFGQMTELTSAGHVILQAARAGGHKR